MSIATKAIDKSHSIFIGTFGRGGDLLFSFWIPRGGTGLNRLGNWTELILKPTLICQCGVASASLPKMSLWPEGTRFELPWGSRDVTIIQVTYQANTQQPKRKTTPLWLIQGWQKVGLIANDCVVFCAETPRRVSWPHANKSPFWRLVLRLFI